MCMKTYPSKKMDPIWIIEGITNDTIEWAQSFGKFLTVKDAKKPLTTSQIRKFYGELKRIQTDPEKYAQDIPMLRAKLAYAVGRDLDKGVNKSKIKEFHDELIIGLNTLRKNKKMDFIHFVKVVEAIIAYHKYSGGED